MEKFSEAKEAARKAVEDRKLGGKKIEDSDKNTSSSSSSPELKSPLHQSTPISPPAPASVAQVEGGKLGMVNGDGSAARKAVNGNSQEVSVGITNVGLLHKHTGFSKHVCYLCDVYSHHPQSLGLPWLGSRWMPSWRHCAMRIAD